MLFLCQKSLMINLVCMCALLNLMDHQRQRMDFILKTLIAAPIILEMRVILQGGLLAFLLLMAGGTGLVLLVKIPILYDLIGNRLEGMVATLVGNAEKADGSSEARALLITRGMQWFRERPLQGYGIDCYRVVLVKNHPSWPIDAYAHNNYVELLVDTGLIGTVLYYWNYAEALRIGWKNRDSIHHTELLAMAMLLALLVGEMALVSYYDKYVQVLVLTLAVLISEFPPEEKWVKPMPFPDIPMGKRYTH